MSEPRPGIPGMPHLSPPHAPHVPHPPAQQQPHAPAHHAPHPPPMRPGLATGPGSARPGIMAPPSHMPSEKELEPLTLVEEAPESTTTTATMAPKKILAFGADLVTKQHAWKRQPVINGNGACRVKSFHGKYSEQGLEYLDNAINEWLDAHAEVEVKFVTSTVMTFEGKIREPALVLNVWY